MQSIITILDHNNNINKKITGDKMIYFKPLRRNTIINIYENTGKN